MMRLSPFYPVLPDYSWLERLVPLGVTTVQLRLKDADKAEVIRQIRASLEICAMHGATLVVNDHWREAIDLGAPCVHLGQEDLAGANLNAIRGSGIALGISSHDRSEREAAIAAAPDYIALGPIYETTLKKMPWRPQGLERIGTWRDACPCPVVAIGGITLERADTVLAAGAASAAVVTDLVKSDKPEVRTQEWVRWAEEKERSAGWPAHRHCASS